MDCDHDPVESDAQLLLTPEQAAARLAICRSKVYELLRRGELESVRIGTSRRVPTGALSEYVDRLRTGPDGMVTPDPDNRRSRPTVLG
jgi:excisionase family DNA binding protein